MESVVRIFDSFEAADRADLDEWLALDGSTRLAIGEAMREQVFGVGARRDFEAFFALLNEKRVRHLVIGGVAYNFHAPPRATKYMDVWPIFRVLKFGPVQCNMNGKEVMHTDDPSCVVPRHAALRRVPGLCEAAGSDSAALPSPHNRLSRHRLPGFLGSS